MRENDANLPILETREMDDTRSENGVRDATETGERTNGRDESVRGNRGERRGGGGGGGGWNAHLSEDVDTCVSLGGDRGRLRAIRNVEIGRNGDCILHGREFTERTVGRSFVAKIFGRYGGRSTREEFEHGRVVRIVEESD